MQRKHDRIKETFNVSPGYFGVLLDHEAPIVLCDCMAFIRNKGLYDVGVFRVPGGQDVVDTMKKVYNEKFPDSTAKESSSYSVINSLNPPPTVNDVASLMKAFFKDLSEPLIPVSSTEGMVSAIRDNDGDEAQIRELSRIVKDMKSPNRECLGFLISFLREICTFKKFNQMSADNLATCFVLSIMGGSDAFDQLYLLGHGAIVIKKLITKAVTLYMPSVQHVKKNTKYKDPAVVQQQAQSQVQAAFQQQALTQKQGQTGNDAQNLFDTGNNSNSATPPKVNDRPKRPNKHAGLPEPQKIQYTANTGNNQSMNGSFSNGSPSNKKKKLKKKARNSEKNSSDNNTNNNNSNLFPSDVFPAHETNTENAKNIVSKNNDEPFPDLVPPNSFRNNAVKPRRTEPKLPDNIDF